MPGISKDIAMWTQTTLLLEMDLSKELRWKNQLGINGLKEWKKNIFNIIDKRVKFYFSQSNDLFTT